MRANRQSQSGFTLVEMIMVIVITGIIGGMVAVFLKAPIQQYVDVARRAELTDVADTAFQRLLRDIRSAVPNSVRLPTPAGSSYIEFLPTKVGGRYRANAGAGALCGVATAANAGDALSFAGVDTCFEIIGPPITLVAGDQLVVGSTQSDGSLPYQAVASATGVRRAVTAGGQTVTFASTVVLPASSELPSQRFQVVDGTQQAVTYACVGTQLMRYWGYGYNATQVAPATIAAGAHSEAVLANNISGCNFVYDIVNQRNALVAITLQITKDGETVSLYEEVHVNNAP